MKYLFLIAIVSILVSCELNDVEKKLKENRGELIYSHEELCNYFISPDENKLIFDGYTSLYFYDFYTKELEELVHVESTNNLLLIYTDWAKEEFYYFRNSLVGYDLYSYNYNTKENGILIDSIYDRRVVVSGDEIAYVKTPKEIWIYNITSGKKKKIDNGFNIINFSSANQEIIYDYDLTHTKILNLSTYANIEGYLPITSTTGNYIWKEGILKGYFYDYNNQFSSSSYVIVDVWNATLDKVLGDINGQLSLSGNFLFIKDYSNYELETETDKVFLSVYDIENDLWYNNIAYGYDSYEGSYDFNPRNIKLSNDENSLYYRSRYSLYKIAFK